MDPQLRRVLNQRITVEKVDTTDARGGTTYADPCTVPCYIAGEVKMIRDFMGKEVVSTLSVFINDAQALSISLSQNDRITLPDGRQPPILGITPYTDEKGNLYSIEVNL